LLAARLLLGCVQSVLTPVSMLWIRSTCPEERRGAAIGIWQAGAKIGPAVGIPLSVWLVATCGWRFLFAAVGIGSLLWLVPWWMIAPDEEAASRTGTSVPEQSPRPSMFTNPLLWGVMTGTFCYQFFFYFCITWMPAYLVEQRHISLQSMGWYSAFSFGGMALMAVAAGWCADRFIQAGRSAFAVRKWFAVAGLLFGATEVIGVWSPSRETALVFATISICGLGLATANHWALTQTAFPPRLIGRATGMQALAASLPGFLAPLTVGWLKQKTGGYTGPAELILLILVIGLASYLVAVRQDFTARG
jgi:predicted MFS family arabinose efflux permease